MRRFVFAPRWMVGHALVVAAVACCVLLGRWQLGRAEITHSMQNMAYALQWPLFAVFFAVMWIRMLRLESRRLDEEADAEHGQGASVADSTTTAASSSPTASSPGAGEPREQRAVPDRGGPAASPRESVAIDDEDDPELAAYNRMLAELAARDREESARRR